MGTGIIRFKNTTDTESFTLDAINPSLATVAKDAIHRRPNDSREIEVIEYTPANGTDTLIWFVWPDDGDQVVDSTGISPPGSVQSITSGGLTGRKHKYPDKVGGYTDDLFVLTEPDLLSPERTEPGYVPNTEPSSGNEPLSLEGSRRIPMKVTIIHP